MTKMCLLVKNFWFPHRMGCILCFLRGQMNYFWVAYWSISRKKFWSLSPDIFPTNMWYQFLSFAQSAISWHVDFYVQQPEAFNFCDLQCSCLQKMKLQTQKGCEKRSLESRPRTKKSCRFFWVSINLLTWMEKGFLWRTNAWNMFTIIFGNPAFDPKTILLMKKFVTVAGERRFADFAACFEWNVGHKQREDPFTTIHQSHFGDCIFSTALKPRKVTRTFLLCLHSHRKRLASFEANRRFILAHFR